MNKKEFLQSLNECYTRLAPTAHGVGVVAIRNIPKGTNPFTYCAEVDTILVTEEELSLYNPAVVELVKDMCVKENGVYDVPSDGIDAIGKNYYLNHSATPNMVTKEGEIFLAARDIAVGEELTVDYRTYDEHSTEAFT